MCHASIIIFAARNIFQGEVKGKMVLEVGSKVVDDSLQGSLKPIISSYKPKQYVGVDVEAGNGVDVICRAEAIDKRFGESSFDMVIATEVLEHIADWKKAIVNMKFVCKPNGIIIVTTRSEGFPRHGYPEDYWRFSRADMCFAFQDFLIETVQEDPQVPGIFIKVVKPSDLRFSTNKPKLSTYLAYSMVTRRKEIRVP